MIHKIKFLSILFATLIFLISCQSDSKNNTTIKSTEVSYEIEEDSYLYGLTLDSIKDINQSIDAIKSLSKRTITRIVFDKIPAKEYTTALNQLAPHTDIMGELFDSEYINDYTFEEYKTRVDEYLSLHGDRVDIWEIGNEVNGEWTGEPSMVAQKTIHAHEEAKKRGYKTALTLYYNDYNYNDGCWAKPSEKMREWATDQLNMEVKNGVDYLFISYYEEDCDNYRPSLKEWESVFSDLGEIFPNAKLGFGEVGTKNEKDKADYLQRYYSLKIKHPRYIGGYFWWYFKQDMVPKSKSLWSLFNDMLELQRL
ncbi:hypothetical protein GSY74_04020 [Sulfurovum sp. bin170]|uniref:hypothetical protein n=1 Tax=Sulfurovum sp. bin170 TaxID=2695268 RepID=UPI0013E008B2|nr:hypothetical protein [Sulfurovum sp. bin170]NEW60440.1 hypothetical protein [Sulfurovum sp. bin170]